MIIPGLLGECYNALQDNGGNKGGSQMTVPVGNNCPPGLGEWELDLDVHPYMVAG